MKKAFLNLYLKRWLFDAHFLGDDTWFWSQTDFSILKGSFIVCAIEMAYNRKSIYNNTVFYGFRILVVGIEVKKKSCIINLEGMLSIFVVLIHASSTNVNVPGHALQSINGLNCSAFIQAFLSNGLCRTAVPLFFIISGFLYYRSFDGSLKQYRIKTLRRIRSLVIPYVFWSGSIFALFTIAQRVPFFKGFFTTRNSTDMSVVKALYYILVESYNSPLWYLKYIIVFSFLSICLYYLFEKMPAIVLLICFWGWFFNFVGLPINIHIRIDALFFYSIGAITGTNWSYLSNTARKILRFKYKQILMVIYITLLIIHSYRLCMAPKKYILEENQDVFLEKIGKMGIIVGILLICIYFYEYRDINEWPWAKYSFLMFVLHHPIVNTLKKILIVIFGGHVSPALSLLVYLLSATSTALSIIAVGKILELKFPLFYKAVCGGR